MLDQFKKEYQQAVTNGFKGTIEDFVSKYYPEASSDAAAAESSQPTIQSDTQQRLRTDFSPPPQPRVSRQVQKAEQEDDDKIWGMNKYAFYALCATVVIVLGIGGALLLRYMRKGNNNAPALEKTDVVAQPGKPAGQPHPQNT